MHHALIISDQLAMTQNIKTEFNAVGWTNKSISVTTMIKSDRLNTADNECLVLVVDREFRRRFGSLITDISTIIAKASRQTPLYLIFEQDYTPSVDAWLPHSADLFKFAFAAHNLHAAITEINRKHIESVPTSAYCSPMAAGF